MTSRDSKKSAIRAPMYVYNKERYKDIAGNATDEVKQHMTDMLFTFMGRGKGFSDAIGGRIKIIEVNIQEKAQEPQKQEGMVVCEIDVEEDMVNGSGNIHGGCSAYLVDLCSTLPICALGKASGRNGIGGVSQVIDVIYHSPARVGERLRIINTTISIGARVMSARSEIWNATHHRLVATGMHIKMEPSPPKL
ncbi:HotDog domain-containing protein [Phellopilus nigrolimitatus]|nr:HotDog domain-containing protein [Phellopilus nigrolimitatus]